MRDLVSIIMPSYNTAPYIRASIQSVQSQSYTNWELLVIDDGSTDETEAILSSLQDARITVIKNEKNLGAAVSRNRALRQARGRWIAFLDSDDLWSPEKLERQIAFMEENGYAFSYTNYEEMDLQGRKTGAVITGPARITRSAMKKFCWPGCLTVMYDRQVVGLVQIEDIQRNNDYAMWLQVSKRADCYLLDEVLGTYRRSRPGCLSAQCVRAKIGWHYRMFRIAERETPMRSAWDTLRNVVFGLYKKFRYCTRKQGLREVRS
jgi:glycosyltransferase involved in cell wall biosynthesis